MFDKLFNLSAQQIMENQKLRDEVKKLKVALLQGAALLVLRDQGRHGEPEEWDKFFAVVAEVRKS